MNALELWVRTPLAQTLGWTLFHFLWEGALIALALAAALYAARPSARLRYGLACIALFLMPVAAAVTFALCTPTPSAALPVHRGGGLHAAVSLEQFLRTPDLSQSGWDRLRWIAPFWVAGVALFYLYSLASWLAARRLRRVGVCPATVEWRGRLDALTRRLGVTRPVALLESCLTDVPVVIGFLKPVILMPVGLLARLSAEQLECILIHELAHVRRHDYLVNLAQSCVEGLLFYHPAMWWVSGLVRAERENCCDDVVVAMRGDARMYALALATLEQNRWGARETALAATGGSLMNRIRRLLKQPEGPRVAATPVISAMVLCATAGVALAGWETQPVARKVVQPAPVAVPVAQPARPEVRLLAQVQPQPQRQAQSQAAPAAAPDDQSTTTLSGPYRKWMNEDVAYIISNEERAAYKNLAADEEREKFIEQFWDRRNPAPGAAGNEFKHEHYRRIAYANEHYASSGLSGWKTDRGRIYITFGPPDVIEDHSAGGVYKRPPEEGGGETTTVPFQQWCYRYIDGVGNNIIIEFVDPKKSGEYRMTSDPSEKDALNVPSGGPNEFARLQQFAALQRPPAAKPAAAAVPNLFTSGQPGPGLSVEVAPGRQAILNIGLPAGAGPFQLVASIEAQTAAQRKVAAAYQEAAHLCTDAGGPWPHCLHDPIAHPAFSLPAGTFVGVVTVRNAAGEVFTNQVSFFVN